MKTFQEWREEAYPVRPQDLKLKDRQKPYWKLEVKPGAHLNKWARKEIDQDFYSLKDAKDRKYHLGRYMNSVQITGPHTEKRWTCLGGHPDEFIANPELPDTPSCLDFT